MNDQNIEQYRQILLEYLKSHPAIAYCSDAIISVSGLDSDSFLLGQISSDLPDLNQGRSSLLLEPDGKLVSTLRVMVGTNGYFILCPSIVTRLVLERFARYKVRVKVELQLLENISALEMYGSIPLDESSSMDTTCSAKFQFGQLCYGLAVYSKSSISSNEFLVEIRDEEYAKYVKALFGSLSESDFHASRNPLQLGKFLEQFVSTSKGCYTGQEFIERTVSRKVLPPRISFLAKHLTNSIKKPVKNLNGASDLEITSVIKRPAGLSAQLPDALALGNFARKVRDDLSAIAFQNGIEILEIYS